MESMNVFFSIDPSTSVMFFFFFNDTATTEIYTLSLHDALPILAGPLIAIAVLAAIGLVAVGTLFSAMAVNTRSEEHTLNSSHGYISYAVFCLKKKKLNTPLSAPTQNSYHNIYGSIAHNTRFSTI